MDSREQLLGAGHLVSKYNCVLSGLTLYLKNMTAEEAENYFAALKSELPIVEMMRVIVALCACDSKGEPIFESADDLAKMNFKVLEEIATAAMRLNGFAPESADDIKKKPAEPTDSGTT